VTVASAGPYASLHLAADRQPHQHPTILFFTGRMPFLLPNQQRQSTEGNCHNAYKAAGILKHIVCHILGYCCRSVDIILQCYYLLLDKNLHLTFEQ